MKVDYEKAYIYTLAGLCGAVGFAASYFALGLLFEDLNNWLDKKIGGE